MVARKSLEMGTSSHASMEPCWHMQAGAADVSASRYLVQRVAIARPQQEVDARKMGGPESFILQVQETPS